MNKVIWLTGLSGAGKTTIAENLRKKYPNSVLLDGDVLRTGLCKDLLFSIEDRKENIRRVSEVAKLFVNNNQTVICSFISPTEEIRRMAKTIIGEDRFVEIYVNTPIEICENRDPKGLYKLAKSGIIKNFTGIDSIYEPPINPNFTLNCGLNSIEESITILSNYLKINDIFDH